jgi:hypothetical protein
VKWHTPGGLFAKFLPDAGNQSVSAEADHKEIPAVTATMVLDWLKSLTE